MDIRGECEDSSDVEPKLKDQRRYKWQRKIHTRRQMVTERLRFLLLPLTNLPETLMHLEALRGEYRRASSSYDCVIVVTL